MKGQGYVFRKPTQAKWHCNILRFKIVTIAVVVVVGVMAVVVAMVVVMAVVMEVILF